MPVSFDRDRPDGRLLAWLAVWSLSLSATVIALLSGLSSVSDDSRHLTLGFAMGGLAAVWITIGTWVALIDLPAQPDFENPDLVHRQNWGPRAAVLVAWIANLAIFAIIARQEFQTVVQLLLVVAIGIMGPLIVWQWTHRRIHREYVSPAVRRGIRHLLEIAVTIAIGSAALKFGDRWFGLTSSVLALVVSIAILWIVMLSIMLSRWWGLMFVTIPIFLGQCITIASLVEIRGQGSDAEVMGLLGMMYGFYFFALLFLLLMRTSHHRWLGARS